MGSNPRNQFFPGDQNRRKILPKWSVKHFPFEKLPNVYISYALQKAFYENSCIKKKKRALKILSDRKEDRLQKQFRIFFVSFRVNAPTNISENYKIGLTYTRLGAFRRQKKLVKIFSSFFIVQLINLHWSKNSTRI